MRQSCCGPSRRTSWARDKCVATHDDYPQSTGQQYQQWRIRQLTDSCINVILLFYVITAEQTLQFQSVSFGSWSIK